MDIYNVGHHLSLAGGMDDLHDRVCVCQDRRWLRVHGPSCTHGDVLHIRDFQLGIQYYMAFLVHQRTILGKRMNYFPLISNL